MEMKRSINDLALFGGRPAFDSPLHVGAPHLGDRRRLMARINEMLDRNWLTNDGPFVREFEQRFAKMAGVKHCVAMCNGTVALEIALRALELKGEVILPSMTFVATAHALKWQGITPVFCDIDSATLNIDPNRVEAMITPQTTAILGVHLWGRACNVEALSDIARRHGLALLFDAAHAFGCTHQGHMIGGFGAAEVFSLHATKFLNTFEGGAVATNNDELATKIRLLRNFGFSGEDETACLGTNGKMSEVAAAMGLTSLESLGRFRAINEGNYRDYCARLKSLPGLQLVEYHEKEEHNYQYVVVELDRSAAGLSRDQVMSVLRAENILARRYFYPGCHRLEPYRSLYPEARRVLPATEVVAERLLVLPNGAGVGREEIETICRILRFVIDARGRLTNRFTVHGPSIAIPAPHSIPVADHIPQLPN
jgi:dTDP-4-amino-4,6-dideoxygalactose transaminase